MSRRNIALILAVCILATLLPATVWAAETSDYIYGDGAAYIEVIPYGYDSSTFTEDTSVSVASGEAVYYAIKLTIPEDVSSDWYDAMATSGIKLEYSSVAADAALAQAKASPEYFCPPPYSKGTSWYLVNTAQGTASPSGGTAANIWQASFSPDCVWTAYAKTSAPEITATITSESGERTVYHYAYYEITPVYNGNTLTSVTYQDMRQDGITIKALLNNSFSITAFELICDGKTYTTHKYNNDMTAYLLDDQVTTLDFVCDIPGKKLKELCDTMSLDFSAVLSTQSLHTNYGWDTVGISSFTWPAKGETPAPELNSDCCYTGSPIMTISNYDVLSNATYKLYRKGSNGYEYDDALTQAMTYPSADTFHLNLSSLTSPAYPWELAISATLPDCTESPLATFQVREPETNEEETITEVLPPDKNDNTTGNNGTGTVNQPSEPAEIWICGPVIRNDPSTPPELEIKKHDEAEVPREGWYDEMHGHMHHGMEPYAYYSVNLNNAAIKDGHHMTVRFYFGREHAGKKVWVLHKCSHHGYVERHDGLWVDRDGFVYITVHSFSPFVIGFDTTAESSSGTSVTYKGGNSFTTSRSATPSSVEIDGVPVAFTGNGSSFTVSSIPAGAKWITIKWPGASVTFNFTPDAQACTSAIAIPKTGSISMAAYALLALAAAATVITKK